MGPTRIFRRERETYRCRFAEKGSELRRVHTSLFSVLWDSAGLHVVDEL